jgi:hypothetical protein
MEKTTVEMVSYRLKNGVTETDLNATHDQVNNFLKAQDGFYYRSLSQGKNGLWYDLVFWQNMECAKAAGDAFMKNPAGQNLIALTDMESVNMQHMEVATEAMTGNCEEAAM